MDFEKFVHFYETEKNNEFEKVNRFGKKVYQIFKKVHEFGNKSSILIKKFINLEKSSLIFE